MILLASCFDLIHCVSGEKKKKNPHTKKEILQPITPFNQCGRYSACRVVAMLVAEGLISCCCNTIWEQQLSLLVLARLKAGAAVPLQALNEWDCCRVNCSWILSFIPSFFTSSSPLRSYSQVWWWHLKFWWTREEFGGFILYTAVEPGRFLGWRFAFCRVFIHQGIGDPQIRVSTNYCLGGSDHWKKTWRFVTVKNDVRVGKKAVLTGLHCVLGKLPDSGFICCCWGWCMS